MGREKQAGPLSQSCNSKCPKLLFVAGTSDNRVIAGIRNFQARPIWHSGSTANQATESFLPLNQWLSLWNQNACAVVENSPVTGHSMQAKPTLRCKPDEVIAANIEAGFGYRRPRHLAECPAYLGMPAPIAQMPTHCGQSNAMIE